RKRSAVERAGEDAARAARERQPQQPLAALLGPLCSTQKDPKPAQTQRQEAWRTSRTRRTSPGVLGHDRRSGRSPGLGLFALSSGFAGRWRLRDRTSASGGCASGAASRDRASSRTQMLPPLSRRDARLVSYVGAGSSAVWNGPGSLGGLSGYPSSSAFQTGGRDPFGSDGSPHE